VLDLGAGTGNLTVTLVAVGAEVVAVEPDPAMLSELRNALPTVRALAGSAEAVPLADGSVDAVLAGHALHWFDMDIAGPEIARVLVPGGVLAGLWNVIDDRVAGQSPSGQRSFRLDRLEDPDSALSHPVADAEVAAADQRPSPHAGLIETSFSKGG
jgi:SAM-dependent methyltransferase